MYKRLISVHCQIFYAHMYSTKRIHSNFLAMCTILNPQQPSLIEKTSGKNSLEQLVGHSFPNYSRRKPNAIGWWRWLVTVSPPPEFFNLSWCLVS